MNKLCLIALVGLGGCCWSTTPDRIANHNRQVLDSAIAQTQTNGGSIAFNTNSGMAYMVVDGKSNALPLIEWGWPPGHYSFWGPDFPRR